MDLGFTGSLKCRGFHINTQRVCVFGRVWMRCYVCLCLFICMLLQFCCRSHFKSHTEHFCKVAPFRPIYTFFQALTFGFRFRLEIHNIFLIPVCNACFAFQPLNVYVKFIKIFIVSPLRLSHIGAVNIFTDVKTRITWCFEQQCQNLRNEVWQKKQKNINAMIVFYCMMKIILRRKTADNSCCFLPTAVTIKW